MEAPEAASARMVRLPRTVTAKPCPDNRAATPVNHCTTKTPELPWGAMTSRATPSRHQPCIRPTLGRPPAFSPMRIASGQIRFGHGRSERWSRTSDSRHSGLVDWFYP